MLHVVICRIGFYTKCTKKKFHSININKVILISFLVTNPRLDSSSDKSEIWFLVHDQYILCNLMVDSHDIYYSIGSILV